MSIPCIPNVAYRSNMEGNQNKVKNNNEQHGIQNEGDANANEVLPVLHAPEAVDETFNVTAEETDSLFAGSDNVTHLHSGNGGILKNDRDSYSGSITMKESLCLKDQYPSKYVVADVENSTLQALLTSGGLHSLGENTSECLARTDETPSAVNFKGATAEKMEGIDETCPTSEIKFCDSIPLEKTNDLSSGAIRGDSEPLLDKDLLDNSFSASSNSFDKCDNPEAAEKMLVDQFLAVSFHPLDVSPENTIVCQTNLSTSELPMESVNPELQMNHVALQKFCSENTLSSFIDACDQSSRGVSQEACSKTVAQINGVGSNSELNAQSILSGSGDHHTDEVQLDLGYQIRGNDTIITGVSRSKKGLSPNQCEEKVIQSLVQAELSAGCRSDGHLSTNVNKAHSLLNGDSSLEPNKKQMCVKARIDSDAFRTKQESPFHEGMEYYYSSEHCNVDNRNLTSELNNNPVETLQPELSKSILVKRALESKSPEAESQKKICGEFGSMRAVDESSQSLSMKESLQYAAENALQSVVHLKHGRHAPFGKKLFIDDALENFKTSVNIGAALCVTNPLCPLPSENINNQETDTNSNVNHSVFVGDRLSPMTCLPPFESTQLADVSSTAANKVVYSSGIPKPLQQHSSTALENNNETGTYDEKSRENIEERLVPKPKPVRPKIITYVRRSPQVITQLNTMSDSTGLALRPPICSLSLAKDQRISISDIKPITPGSVCSVSCEKNKLELQKPRIYTSGLMVSGIKPPGHPISQAGEKLLTETAYEASTIASKLPQNSQYGVPTTIFRPTMILRPQLGMGAMSRLPAAKNRILVPGQKLTVSSSHLQGQVANTSALYYQDTTVEQNKGSVLNAARSNLPKPCPSGLRPPGYSRLSVAKLAAFGFVRSSSVSSVSSNQSNESVHSDPSKTTNRVSAVKQEPSSPKTVASSSSDIPKAVLKTVHQNTGTGGPRRSLLPAPKVASIPSVGLKKEVPKDSDASRPVVSSPKRMVMSAVKLHSPGHAKLKSGIIRNGFSTKGELPSRETERQIVQKLKDKCEEQARQLQGVREELKRASLVLEAFAVTTQHFVQKNESALEKEKELTAELANIRDEVAFNTARCEKLQKEKEELERRFETEVRRLHQQQHEELLALEEKLKLRYSEEVERLREEHELQLERIRIQHLDEIEDITAKNEAAVIEMENNHTVAIAILQDEHDSKLSELKAAHELERQALEDNFEKLRLSLQDQVDTLTFQNRSLKDRARRFEQALRRSTDEQIETALAPYQHLEEDMNSLKQVLEMKNNRIHEQEKKIMELEKLAEKNVLLEEKIQVLQQQNEDLKARIDQSVAMTRQLSVENAALHENVEKESEEKKRLSRTNEELLWRLQTGEPVSPVRLSPSSSIGQASKEPLSPSTSASVPR
ncbi:microtubule-associated tumor suppressor candidate 2 [Protopterus annectens]|uniref:microtubule-associated tumor suppressor candidate 2 n=1 Tax=Protopterus annectens TaxID=7888 RepID=UPI001CF9DDD5|nr:microtubule-associated tumor suppressor candidate 2 [Protopterus annectens]